MSLLACFRVYWLRFCRRCSVQKTPTRSPPWQSRLERYAPILPLSFTFESHMSFISLEVSFLLLICNMSFHSSSTSWWTFSTPWRLRFRIDRCLRDPWVARTQWATLLWPVSLCSRSIPDRSPPATTNACRNTCARLTGSALLISDPRASSVNLERKLNLYYRISTFVSFCKLSILICEFFVKQLRSKFRPGEAIRRYLRRILRGWSPGTVRNRLPWTIPWV